MAARACSGDVDGVNCGPGILWWSYIVDTMAIDAYGNFGVSSRKEFAMHAGVVLVQLVRTQSWIERFDISRIRMATSTQLWNLFAIDLALEPSLFPHGDGWIVAACIASVATGAGQALLRMDVLTELVLSNFQWIWQSRVTLQTGVCCVRGLPITQAHSEHNLPDQPDVAGCA